MLEYLIRPRKSTRLHLRTSIFQNFLGEHAPRPLDFSKTLPSNHNFSKLAMDLLTIRSQNLYQPYGSKVQTQIVGVTSKWRPHNIFWCFPTISKVFFRNVEGTTLAMLRKFFWGPFNMCFPTLLSLFFYKSFSRLLHIQLYS